MKLNATRIKFILTHTAVATLISSVSFFTGAGLLHAAYAGLCWLVAKEVGEIIGRMKEKKIFTNNLKSNLLAVKDAVDDPWQLMQTVVPVLLYIGIMLLIGLLNF